MRGIVYRRREGIVTMSHLWTMVSRNMFLRLNLIFNLVSDGNNIFFTSLIWLFFIHNDEMACSNIILPQHIQNYPKTLFYFFIHDCQIYPVCPVFSVGRNEDKFVICFRVKVFTCTVLMEYSVAHLQGTLNTRLFDKNRNFIFSGLLFRPTPPSEILFSSPNHL